MPSKERTVELLAMERVRGAADDLLEALEEAQKRLRGDRDAMPLKDLRPLIQAAISKAVGD